MTRRRLYGYNCRGKMFPVLPKPDLHTLHQGSWSTPPRRSAPDLPGFRFVHPSTGFFLSDSGLEFGRADPGLLKCLLSYAATPVALAAMSYLNCSSLREGDCCPKSATHLQASSLQSMQSMMFPLPLPFFLHCTFLLCTIIIGICSVFFPGFSSLILQYTRFVLHRLTDFCFGIVWIS